MEEEGAFLNIDHKNVHCYVLYKSSIISMKTFLPLIKINT